MTDQEKISSLEEIMDIDRGSLNPSDNLDDIDEWDSLAALSYIIFMNDKFNRKISGKDIRNFKTVNDIMQTMEHI